MARLYGLLSQACGSLAVALLAVALAAAASRNAFADTGPVAIGPQCTGCTTSCVGNIGATCYENGQNGATCSASCTCVSNPPNQPNCQPVVP